MQKYLAAFSLIFLFTISAFSQSVSPTPKPVDTEKLEKEAVEFLRETQTDVGNMRSLENRLSFSAELASLMWYKDEKEARTMYLGVTGDFKQLIAEYDQQMNLTAAMPEQDDDAGSVSMFKEGGTKAQLQRKFGTAISLRQSIALSLAEHEPDMAVAFYYDSVASLSNPDLRATVAGQDNSFEFQLMTLVADTNVAKSLELGKKSLDKGVNGQHVELLKKIYAKDADKGAEFAAAIISSLKSGGGKDTELWVYGSLLSYADEIAVKVKKDGKKAVMSNNDMRDLADAFGQKILAADDESAASFYDLIAKYAPARAIQLRAKAKNKTVTTSIQGGPNPTVISTTPETPIETAPLTPAEEKQIKAEEERAASDAKMATDVINLGSKSMPKDNHDKIVADARAKIAKAKGRDAKITGYSTLAAQVAKSGDKDLADEIMKDAERLVNPQPKNYQDFLFAAMLASGYADADPDKAFPLLNDTILRLNDTISGFVKAAEFIDVEGDMIDDGEFQVGQFGGSMIRDLSTELIIAQPTLRKLAIADFSKTKALTNSFDRVEVRVLAKMLVLRAILGDKKESGADDFLAPSESFKK